jgi:hypothetical protein
MQLNRVGIYVSGFPGVTWEDLSATVPCPPGMRDSRDVGARERGGTRARLPARNYDPNRHGTSGRHSPQFPCHRPLSSSSPLAGRTPETVLPRAEDATVRLLLRSPSNYTG